MNPLIGLRRLAERRPYAFDACLAACLYAFVIVAVATDRQAGQEAGGVRTAALGGLFYAVLVLRRTWPRTILAITVAGHITWLVVGDAHSPLALAAVVAMYTVGAQLPRPTAWATGAITALALSCSGVLLSHDPWQSPEVLGQVAWAGMATAAGDAARSRRAYIAAIEERACRAERTREEEARRRVVEERLRIARELHDVLAHHIALINVQAQVAEHVLEATPGQAREALGHIRLAGRAALDELRTTVGLLRQPGVPGELGIEPAPGLDRLPDLIASVSAAGLAVDHRVKGTVRPLPAAVDLTAYRVIQEALTNVRKHAGDTATARLRVRYAPAELDIEIVDTGPGAGGPAAPGQGTGHGLIGMRERAHSLGGAFTAGPLPGGGFRVRAVLPTTEAGSATSDDAAHDDAAQGGEPEPPGAAAGRRPERAARAHGERVRT